MKVFMTNFYSYDYEAKAETDKDDDAEIHFMIAFMKAWMVTKKRAVKWLSLRSRRNPQRFVNHQNQIVRTVQWLNQQLIGSPQKG